MKIAICDDDKSICKKLKKLIESYLLTNSIHGQIDTFFSTNTLRDYMNHENQYDLLFLDIEMEDINGVEFGHILREEMENNKTEIVYISWESSYAMDLFKVRPMDFILKPLEKEKLFEVLERAFKLINRNDVYFSYSSNGEMWRVPLNDIIYFTSHGRKVCIHMFNEKIEFYGKLDEIMENLEINLFWRIHKSCLINYYQSKKFEYTQVFMNDGSQLSISQKYRVDIRNKQKEILNMARGL